MTVQTENVSAPVRRMRHRGRGAQILIYLGKQFRFFINQSDWKVLPMAALIAALVTMVVRNRLFISMEGSLMGAFALTCVAIWNGCFNSIQAVCRERPIIKREHRSGMHITSYIIAHMIYQFVLCLAQTALSLFVMKSLGVHFELGHPMITPWIIVDLGLTMLLISYASDMMSLLISSIAHTTTGAMTVMPFVLIFQLVFSGGIIPLPAWSRPLTNFTISSYGTRAIAAQTDYNDRDMLTIWDTLKGMRDNEIGGTFTLGQLMDVMENPVLDARDDMVIVRSLKTREMISMLSPAHPEGANPTAPVGGALVTVGQLLDLLGVPDSGDMQPIRAMTLGDVLDMLPMTDEERTEFDEREASRPITLGQIRTWLRDHREALEPHRDESLTLNFTIGEVFDILGAENVEREVKNRTRQASYKAEYESTVRNVLVNWLMLGVFTVAFAFAATVVLELIDKDKR